MEGKIKLKANIVKNLKSRNTTYPLTSEDYDAVYIHELLTAIYTKAELKVCALESSLRALDSEKLKFAKGIIYIH